LEAKGFERGSRLHASGHASAKELLEMIVKIKPEILIPVHTRNPFYFSGELKNTEIKVMIPEAGQTFII
jgi:mRNA degradation ribonuclease J1/J2